jgi:hypothetical protein
MIGGQGGVASPYPGPSASSFVPQQHPVVGHDQQQSQGYEVLGKRPFSDVLEAQCGPSRMSEQQSGGQEMTETFPERLYDSTADEPGGEDGGGESA